MAKIWTDFERDDLNQIPKAVKLGWLPNFDYRDRMHGRTTPDNCPHDTVSFVKDIKHTWKGYKHSYEGLLSYWIVADLIEKHYCNHRQYDTLDLVFENE